MVDEADVEASTATTIYPSHNLPIQFQETRLMTSFNSCIILIGGPLNFGPYLLLSPLPKYHHICTVPTIDTSLEEFIRLFLCMLA